jgi:PBSX family phage terminase large subunit
MAAIAPERNETSTRRYRARGAALRLWRDRRPEIVLSGPAGTGKSRGCLEKLHACALKFPGMRALIVRKTRESLTESALVTFESKVVPRMDPLVDNTQRRLRQAYHYPNGSEIVVGGMDKASKVMSTEYDLIYAQEAIEFTEADWEALISRLRNGVMPFQQIIGDTNPDTPTHWLRRRSRDGDPLFMDESRHEDNPVLFDEKTGAWTPFGLTYITRLDSLTGVRRLRLRLGQWVSAEGMVYERWDRNRHIIDRFEIPPYWRRFRAVDFGYTNPFVCQWWAIDDDGRMYLYREIYYSQKTVRWHANRINILSQFDPNGVETTICDHDREDRATLEEEGIATEPAYKAISVGVQAVDDRMAIAGDGKPRIMIMRDSLDERDYHLDSAKLPTSTAEEVDGYVFKRGQDGRILKEQPIDKDNHGMDAMRYAVAYVDELGGSLRGEFGRNPMNDLRRRRR